MKKAIWINPRSKGNLGCTLVCETGVSWLLRHGIDWWGRNLDDRHPAFANRYPQRVTTVSLGSGIAAKNAMLKLFRDALDSTKSVQVIDACAQGDLAIIDNMENLKICDLADGKDVAIVVWIIPYDDDEHTRNLIDVIARLDNRVRWMVVKNPVKSACHAYHGSGMQKALNKLGAREIELPGITAVTRMTLERVCLRIGRELSLSEAALDERLPLIMRGELQAFLANVFDQLDLVAGHLLPDAEAAKIKPTASPPSRVRKVIDLLADYGGNGER